MQYAPIIVFAFNRLEALKATIASVLQNSEAAESELYVFVDGARPNKQGEIEKVHQVQEFVKTIFGFKSIHYTFAKQNKGLGPSIIAGVTDVINQYGRAIILEDDLIVAQNFLSFMNQGLDKYEKEEKVFSVCGYSNKVKTPNDYLADSYFCVRSSSWGWATWANRWNSVDWDLKDWKKYEGMKSAFNRWGGSDCFGMLQNWKEGRNKSWAIRFCFSQFLQKKLSLFPIVSKVNNDGFDGDGTNCKKYNRFKFEFDSTDRKTFKFPAKVLMNEGFRRSALSYHSLVKRIWSKIMYMIYR